MVDKRHWLDISLVVFEVEVDKDLNELTECPIEFARSLGIDFLRRLGVEDSLASLIIDDMLRNELDGYASHGLLRLIDFRNAVQTGKLLPNNEPIVCKSTDISCVVDGNGSPGLASANVVVCELTRLTEQNGFSLVGLLNSNHIGRLASIGRPLAERGFVVFGFVNFLGAGQNVAPWKGADGRFCTNPVLFAFPNGPTPILIDFSTSAVAEGKVRQALLSGSSVPDGWLVDKNWKPVNAPEELYSKTRQALLAPLGGDQGHKGFALAFAVEILAGIISGGGHIGRPGGEGNGGFFLCFNPELLGRSLSDILDEIECLSDYIKTSTPCDFDGIRLPGDRSSKSASDLLSTSRLIRVPRLLIEMLRSEEHQ